MGTGKAVERYGAAVAGTALALLARLTLDPYLHDHLPYTTFFVAVAAVAWFADLGPALLSTGLGFLAAQWFFVPPRHALRFETTGDAVAAGSYFMVTLAIAFFSHATRKAREHALVRQRGLEREIADHQHAKEALRESEERFRTAFEDGAIGMALTGLSGRFLRVNAALCQMLGRSQAELAGRDFTEVTHPDLLGENLAGKHQVISGAAPSFRMEERYLRKDGSVIWGEMSTACVRDAQGKPLYLVSHVQDISERKRMGEALQKARDELEIRVQERTAELEKTSEALGAERRRFNDVLDMLPAYIILLTPDYHVSFANRFFRERFGESHGRRCFEYLFGRSEPCEFCETYKVLETMTPHEWEWTGPDGRNYQVFDFPFSDANGSTLILEMGLDITERKRAEETIRRQADHHATMLAASSDGFWRLSTEGKLLDVNDAFCRMSGHSRAELLNLHIADIEAVESPEEVDRHIRKMMEAGFDRFESQHRTKAGWIMDVEVSAFFSRATGQMLAFVRDITARKQAEAELEQHRHHLEGLVTRRTNQLQAANARLQTEIDERNRAEEALRESEGRLRMAMRTARMVAWSWDPGADRILWAGDFAEICGRPPVGRADEAGALVHPDDRERRRATLDRVARAGGSFAHEFRIVRPDNGAVVWVEERGEARMGEQGQVRSLTGVVIDITDRKQAEERLRQSQKLESLGLLAGGVAHDFNNLLVGVIGNASLALDLLPHGDPVAELLERIVKTGEQAAHLTRQMLAYSGKGRFLVEPVNLPELVAEMSDLVRPSVPKKVALDLELDHDIPCVEADRGQIQQVFMNLVLNAAEAIGGNAGLISVKTGVEDVDERYAQHNPEAAELRPGRYTCLVVRDTGCGMDDVTRARIFDPFFSTKFSGRGLGLAAVAGIVRGHNGVIQVSSAPGQGSCFTVLFPAAERAVAVSASGASAAAPRGAGTVLVVDDEELVLQMAKKALERSGFEVLLADSGPAAIDVFKREPRQISLVLLDLSMPGMSGEEILPELRKIRPEVSVVVSSGYTEAETMRMFRGHRVSGFIQKPYTANVLAEKVKSAIS